MGVVYCILRSVRIRIRIIRSSLVITSVPVRSFASDTYVLYTVGRSCERGCGPVAVNFILCKVGRSCERGWPSSCGRNHKYCVVLKRHCIVCYCIASVPVCVFCDGRTHGQTHNPILSGIRCFLRRRNDATQRNDANSQIIVLICCLYSPKSCLRSKTT